MKNYTRNNPSISSLDWIDCDKENSNNWRVELRNARNEKINSDVNYDLMPNTKTNKLVFTTQEKKIMMPQQDYDRFISYLKNSKGDQIQFEEGTFTC